VCVCVYVYIVYVLFIGIKYGLFIGIRMCLTGVAGCGLRVGVAGSESRAWFRV